MKVGRFEIEVWDGGTRWVHLRIEQAPDKELVFTADELEDLEYAVKWALKRIGQVEEGKAEKWLSS